MPGRPSPPPARRAAGTWQTGRAMKTPPCALIALPVALALAALPTRGAEKTVAELEKELAVAKAELAVLKAETDLAAKKAALKSLQDGAGATGAGPATESGPEEAPPKKAGPAAPPVTATTEDLQKYLPASFTWRQVEKSGTDLLWHAGTRVVAPYTIDPATKELKTDGTRLGGYLELLYSNTWAWQPDGAAASIAYGADPALPGGSQWNGSWKNTKLLSDSDAVLVTPGQWFTDPDDTVDYTARVSLEFANGAERSAATVTGSGNFSGEVAVGAHFLQGYAKNTLFTLGVGGAVGATTDREARRVHPRYFAGLVGKLSRVVDVDGKGKKRLALAHLGLGYAQVDNVQFDPADATKTHLLFDGPVPRYRHSRGPALELELFYPLSDANYAYLGARVYDRTDPGQWSLTLGYSFDLVQFLGGFQSKSNAAEPTTAKGAEAKK